MLGSPHLGPRLQPLVDYEDNNQAAVEGGFLAHIIAGRATSLDSSMALLEHQTSRLHFGVDDQPSCPRCGNSMHLTARVTHPEYGDFYERQTFACDVCNYQSLRSADAFGHPRN